MKAACLALLKHASEFPNAVAIVDKTGQKHTWRSIADGAERIRASVEQASERGDHVALSLPSGGLFWMCLLGVAQSGRRPVLVPHPLPGTIRSLLERAIAPRIMIDREYAAHMLGPEADNTVQAVRAASNPSAGECGLVLLSSGTTGHSHFVLRSSDSIDEIGRILLDEQLFQADDRVASCIPMSHAFGFEHAFLGPLLAGACVEVFDNFAIDLAATAITRGATTMPLVPATAAMIAGADIAPGKLRSCTVAGAPLPSTVRAAFENALCISLVDLYGATELGTIWLDRGRGGIPVRGVEVRIVNPSIVDRLVDVPDNTEGEVVVRSTSMCEGLVQTGGALRPNRCEGFLRTGDLGLRNSGAYRISGRLKLVFDVGGLKVNPIEVEQALETHPKVHSALVYPVSTSSVICRVAARIQPVNESDPPTTSELRAFLVPHLPAHALPRTFEFVRLLPRTANGKLIRDPLSTATADGNLVHEQSAVQP